MNKEQRCCGLIKLISNRKRGVHFFFKCWCKLNQNWLTSRRQGFYLNFAMWNSQSVKLLKFERILRKCNWKSVKYVSTQIYTRCWLCKVAKVVKYWILMPLFPRSYLYEYLFFAQLIILGLRQCEQVAPPSSSRRTSRILRLKRSIQGDL